MATWNGDVYNIKLGWEYNSDHDSSITSVVDVTGLWSSLQFYMRHVDSGRTIHAMVTGRDDSGVQWSGSDCYIWSNI